MLSVVINSVISKIADLTSILVSATFAVRLTFVALLSCAVVSSVIGACIAIAEHRSIIPQRWARLIAALVLLMVFYPRQISQSGLTFLLTMTAHAHFAQSAWGLAVVSIPTSTAMSYLIFSTCMSVSDVTSLPSQFLKNSAEAPLTRTMLITSIPIQPMMAAVIAIIFCGMSFQAALLGRSGANTVGSYFLRRMSATELDSSNRAMLSLAACLCLLVLLVGVAVLVYVTMRRLSIFALEKMPVQNGAGNISTRTLIRSAVLIISILAGVSALFLHIFLIFRLAGIAGEFARWMGISHGALESTPPTLTLLTTSRLLENTFDVALAGAVVGASLSISLWFSIVRHGRTPRRTLWARLTYFLALFAFLPSAFSGAIGLTLPYIKVTMPFLMATWGAVTASCLTLLLVAPQMMNSSVSRYPNLGRTRGLMRTVAFFFREYGVLCIGLLTACLVGNALDNGFRDQMGIVSLGTRFIDRQGFWDSDLRGIALVIMVVALFSTIALGRNRAISLRTE